MNNHSYYIRNPRSVIINSATEILLVDANGTVFKHATTCAAAWSKFMQNLTAPLKGHNVKEMAASISELDDVLLDRLLQTTHLLESADTGTLIDQWEKMFSENRGYHFIPGKAVCKHLVFASTGSVVSGQMAPVILSLCYSQFQQQLDVILTQTAQKFITRDFLESYGIQTWCDPFERKNGIYVPHVHLGQSADCIVVMPASANAIYRIANATCTDLLSTTIVASNAAVVIVPSMNEAMWNSPAVQNNIQQLLQNGTYVIEPTTAFGAADFSKKKNLMYGGHGTLWSGPVSLMHSLAAILTDKHSKNPFALNKFKHNGDNTRIAR